MLNDDFTRPLFRIDFWSGTFYLIFKFFTNLAFVSSVIPDCRMAVRTRPLEALVIGARLPRRRTSAVEVSGNAAEGLDRALFVP
jgi:hypothetical protein